MNLEHLPLSAVYHPATAKSSIHPEFLMIVMHGRGDSPEGFAWLPDEIKLPGLNYLMLQAPDDYFTGYSWYDLRPNHSAGIVRSRGLLKTVFDELLSQGYQNERIILCGFSQGCAMTFDFGGHYARPLAGYLGISGFCNEPEALVNETLPVVKEGNWLITHGTRDEVLPFAETAAQVSILKQGGFQIDFRAYEKTHTIDPVVELPFIRRWIQTILDKKADR